MKYREHEWSSEVRYWIEHNLKNYESKTNRQVIQAEHIIDYLLSNRSPKRLKKMSVLEALNNAEKWSKSLAKKGNNIIETSEDIKVIKDLGEGFRLVKLLTEDAYKREGAMIRHCVASYYNNSKCYIYSIRDSKNQSHCTLEVFREGNDINQIKGKIDPKYIKYVIKSLNLLGMKVRSSELNYLGYVDLEEISEGFTQWIKDVKFMTFKGKEYAYENSLK